MSASALVPSAPTTLAIILGASAWPSSPGFQASEAFVHAAHGFREYLLDSRGFSLPAANLLDLFDAPSGSSDQLEQLGSFLQQQSQALITAQLMARDVLVYFVGHGGFVGSSHDFYLMPRRANASSLRASGLSIDALAEVLREQARQTRRYLFLDCCFAAAAFRSFQGGPDQTAIEKTLDAFAVHVRHSGFPRKGTVLLCSSDQKSPSLLLPDESATMFSAALLNVLRNGDRHRPSHLSLRDLKELAEDRLAASLENNAPRPGLYSPDQSEGDVADVPFFPNPRAEEGLVHASEEHTSPHAVMSSRTSDVHLDQSQRAGSTSRRRGEPEEPARQPISRRKVLLGVAGLATVAVAGSSIALLTHTYPSTKPPAATSTPVSTSSGAMFGYDLRHTHFNPQEHILSPTTVSGLVSYWTATTGNQIRYSSPVVAGDTVYVGSEDSKLYAFHAATGSILWTATTGGSISPAPAVVGGVVYVGSTDGRLYAFHAATGSILWTASTSGVVGSSPAVAGGVVYVGSLDQKLYAFHAATGSILWTASTGNWVSSSPAVANGVVYVGSWDHRLYAFHAATGNILWIAFTGDAIAFSSPAVVGDVVYVGSTDHKLYAFHAATGNILWTATTGGSIGNPSPAVAGDIVYTGSGDHKLYAFHAATGSILWTATTGDSINSSPAVANGVVYVGSDDHKLYAFHAATGTILWTASTGGPIRSSPAVEGGVVYVGSWDHKLYAFHLPT